MSDIQKTENRITTYMERSLHLTLKEHFCPDSSMHEVKIGRFVADACDGKTIFEIQTGNLGPLRKKLEHYLENTDYEVVVVHPVAKNRRIFWINDKGVMEKSPRLSSKHENIASGISDLFYLSDLLGRERITFCFPIMEIDEVRLLDGYGKHKKIRATSADRIAGEIYSIEYIKDKDDVARYILPLLPDEPFSRDKMSRSLRLSGLKLWGIQKLMLELGFLCCKKDGRRLIFEKSVQR